MEAEVGYKDSSTRDATLDPGHGTEIEGLFPTTVMTPSAGDVMMKLSDPWDFPLFILVLLFLKHFCFL